MPLSIRLALHILSFRIQPGRYLYMYSAYKRPHTILIKLLSFIIKIIILKAEKSELLQDFSGLWDPKL